MATSLHQLQKTNAPQGELTVGEQVTQKLQYLEKRKDLLGSGIPSHMTVEREIRTAAIMMMNSKELQVATPASFYTAVSVAINSGIGLGNGKGYLVAYKGNCSFVPGWKGLVDLVSRTGRAMVWTGVVHEGDHFNYRLGDSPFLDHRAGDVDDHKKITYYYAIGRVKGAEWPIIEVWSVNKVNKHLAKNNKVGSRHYALANDNNFEMYGRKVVLLQVIKYLPQSLEIENAISANTAAETNSKVTVDANFVMVEENDQSLNQSDMNANSSSETVERPMSDEAPNTPKPELSASEKLAKRLANASDIEMLDADADLIRDYPSEDQKMLTDIYKARREFLNSETDESQQLKPQSPRKRGFNLE